MNNCKVTIINNYGGTGIDEYYDISEKQAQHHRFERAQQQQQHQHQQEEEYGNNVNYVAFRLRDRPSP